MYCMKCGNKLGEASKFCGYCGTPVGNTGVAKKVIKVKSKKSMRDLKNEGAAIVENVIGKERIGKMKDAAKNADKKKMKKVAVAGILAFGLTSLVGNAVKAKNNSDFFSTLSTDMYTETYYTNIYNATVDYFEEKDLSYIKDGGDVMNVTADDFMGHHAYLVADGLPYYYITADDKEDADAAYKDVLEYMTSHADKDSRGTELQQLLDEKPKLVNGLIGHFDDCAKVTACITDYKENKDGTIDFQLLACYTEYDFFEWKEAEPFLEGNYMRYLVMVSSGASHVRVEDLEEYACDNYWYTDYRTSAYDYDDTDYIDQWEEIFQKH